LLDEFLIEIHAIGQEHIGIGAPVLVVAERLAFLRAVDAAEADAFRVLVVQNFEGVAIEDTGDTATHITRKTGGRP
jgi:hypothetical protein